MKYFCALGLLLSSALSAVTPSETAAASSAQIAEFQPFTGKITGNKVRARLRPAYDAPVWRELGGHELVVVCAEEDDFYAIQPPEEVKGYVFRTYVLDGIVEGNRVNVRLQPDLDAPVLTQLQTGDRVVGTVAAAHSKWLEIALPDTVRFYVAREYVAKVGDAGLKAHLDAKKQEGYRHMQAAQELGALEMGKPIDQIDINRLKCAYAHLITDYPEFPELAERAQQAWESWQAAYLARRWADLESQSRPAPRVGREASSTASPVQKERVDHREQPINPPRSAAVAPALSSSAAATPSAPSPWQAVEDHLFAQWSEQTGRCDRAAFYEEQRRHSFVLRGMVEPYRRPIKVKPGDYMLVSSASKLPIAFLYSTCLNLQDYVGKEVALIVVPRPNHHFAFPAYLVLGLE